MRIRRLYGNMPNGSLAENSGLLAKMGSKRGRAMMSVEDALDTGEDILEWVARGGYWVRTVELRLGPGAFNSRIYFIYTEKLRQWLQRSLPFWRWPLICCIMKRQVPWTRGSQALLGLKKSIVRLKCCAPRRDLIKNCEYGHYYRQSFRQNLASTVIITDFPGSYMNSDRGVAKCLHIYPNPK